MCKTVWRKGNIWVHKTSLTPPLFIKVPVPSQKTERPCICVLGVVILPLSKIFLLFLLLLLQMLPHCRIFCFPLYCNNLCILDILNHYKYFSSISKTDPKNAIIANDTILSFIIINSFHLQILFLIIVCPLLINCGIRKTRLPSKLLDCMKVKTREDRTVSDEEISTSCLLEFMWLKGKKCDDTSPGTVDWLELLIKQGLIIDKQGRRRKRAVNGRLGFRKEYRMLSAKERRDYHNAINAMKNDKVRITRIFWNLVTHLVGWTWRRFKFQWCFCFNVKNCFSWLIPTKFC